MRNQLYQIPLTIFALIGVLLLLGMSPQKKGFQIDKESWTQLNDRVKRIETAVLRMSPLSRQEHELYALKGDNPVTHWKALDALAKEHEANKAMARKKLLFLTAKAALERFGTPDEVRVGKYIHWVYKKGNEEDDDYKEYILNFRFGVVLDFEIE